MSTPAANPSVPSAAHRHFPNSSDVSSAGPNTERRKAARILAQRQRGRTVRVHHLTGDMRAHMSKLVGLVLQQDDALLRGEVALKALTGDIGVVGVEHLTSGPG